MLGDRIITKCRADPASGCWEWVGHRNRDGYGRLRVLGRMWLAHRFSFCVFVGPIPDGALVCHRCDNPACVNPDHLFLGSPRDNTLDMVEKGRGSCGFVRGERHGRAKLTSAQVEEIRGSSAPQKALANQYGVTQSTVSKIQRGVRWAPRP